MIIQIVSRQPEASPPPSPSLIEEAKVTELTENSDIENAKAQRSQNSSEDSLCAICFDKFNTTQPSKQLTCSHRFHFECVSNWALSQNARHLKSECPLCKKEILPSELGFFSGIPIELQPEHDADLGARLRAVAVDLPPSCVTRVFSYRMLYAYKVCYHSIFHFSCSTLCHSLV